ncbi:hypothetical protein HELRODRAFT_164081 [Helobdella robusta]|uniref:Endonuclease/exonuclease/phosphatase domain-containing protein n=1 Tax=Helobdella robusta TaxID=6412 RepID=T1EUW3_HELRO|nr:hypothetical protein HELRODRAFT_164081 [Helobdella robusta]ESN94273.1 hypothetical protein HELRODRAFT_164081 [Helobdella robusta]
MSCTFYKKFSVYIEQDWTQVESHFMEYEKIRPPNSDPSNLIQKLDLALSSLKTNSKVYLVGDFNLDLSKACSDKLVASFSDLLASFNFVPLISQPTRVTHSSSSIIDNIFTSNLSHHISGILLHDFSDHFPIFALCPNHCFPIPTAPIKLRRNLCPDSLRKINLQLSVQDWSSVTTQDNINTCCSTFYAILFYILDSVSPLLPNPNRTVQPMDDHVDVLIPFQITLYNNYQKF